VRERLQATRTQRGQRALAVLKERARVQVLIVLLAPNVRSGSAS
jgi:hypothetical protein